MSLSEDYKNHFIFERLELYADFYNSLGFSVLPLVIMGTRGIGNIDSYVYSSIKGTLESIKDILYKGRINDAYALLRKYFDSAIINVYSDLYLFDQFSNETFIVKQIDDWVKGKDKLPEYSKMSKYIKSSNKPSPITELLLTDNTYDDIRQRCNDHTHYNFYHNLLLNDNEIFLKQDRVLNLDQFAQDLENVFILHLSYVFFLNDAYMMSHDYIGSMDLGITPEEGSQYYVAPYIQNIFDNVIKKRRMDIANVILKNTSMDLK